MNQSKMTLRKESATPSNFLPALAPMLMLVGMNLFARLIRCARVCGRDKSRMCTPSATRLILSIPFRERFPSL